MGDFISAGSDKTDVQFEIDCTKNYKNVLVKKMFVLFFFFFFDKSLVLNKAASVDIYELQRCGLIAFRVDFPKFRIAEHRIPI